MEEILVGTSLPKTGAYAKTQFMQYSRAYELWMRQVNEADGLLGRQVRLVWHDDFGLPERCSENYLKLINNDHVDLLLGPCHSILIEPAAPVAEQAHMILLEGSGSVSEMFRKGREWLFLCWDADCNYMKSFLEFMALPSNPRQISKVATVAGDRPRGHGHARGVHQHASRLSLEVVFDERIQGSPDYADIFQRAKASGADVIMWDIEERGESKRHAIDAAVKAGFATSQLWLSENPSEPVVDGVFSRVTWLPSDSRPMSQQFLKDFQSAFGEVPEFHSAGGYACGQVLAQAVTAVGSLDNTKLREALLEMTFETVMGPLRYGDDGLSIATFPLAQWQSGRAEIVFPDVTKTKDPVFS